VGKGRDVGLNQISLFEAKVACGNGEQVLSRDIYRLGHRFDFFRMLSCYFTTVGFYISSMVMYLGQYLALYFLQFSVIQFLMFLSSCCADGCHNSLCFLVWKAILSIKWA
jgi:callose synthase